MRWRNGYVIYHLSLSVREKVIISRDREKEKEREGRRKLADFVENVKKSALDWISFAVIFPVTNNYDTASFTAVYYSLK